MENCEIKTYRNSVTAYDIKGRTVVGYPSTFGNIDRHGDIIKKGAYLKTIRERGPKGRKDIGFLWQHQGTNPIGWISKLEEDDTGLYGELVLSKTQLGNDALELIKDGVITSFSIGFSATKKSPGPKNTRLLTEIELEEISLVTIPANPEAIITDVKNHINHKAAHSALRNGNYSDDTFLWLQEVIESLDADPLEKLVKRLSDRSSYLESDAAFQLMKLADNLK